MSYVGGASYIFGNRNQTAHKQKEDKSETKRTKGLSVRQYDTHCCVFSTISHQWRHWGGALIGIFRMGLG